MVPAEEEVVDADGKKLDEKQPGEREGNKQAKAHRMREVTVAMVQGRRLYTLGQLKGGKRCAAGKEGEGERADQEEPRSDASTFASLATSPQFRARVERGFFHSTHELFDCVDVDNTVTIAAEHLVAHCPLDFSKSRPRAKKAPASKSKRKKGNKEGKAAKSGNGEDENELATSNVRDGAGVISTAAAAANAAISIAPERFFCRYACSSGVAELILRVDYDKGQRKAGAAKGKAMAEEGKKKKKATTTKKKKVDFSCAAAAAAVGLKLVAKGELQRRFAQLSKKRKRAEWERQRIAEAEASRAARASRLEEQDRKQREENEEEQQRLAASSAGGLDGGSGPLVSEYEAARLRRMQENKKKLQELGLL